MMSKIKDIVSKNRVVTALILDSIGLIISFLVNTNLTNIFLARIALFFYCIRFELIFILIILIILQIHNYLVSKQLGYFKIVLSCLFFIPLIVLSVIYFKPIRQLIVARYYYFNNGYYVEESQKFFLDRASECIDKREWDNSIKYFNLAKEVYPNADNIKKIDENITNSEMCVKYCTQLFDSYVKPDKNHISKNSYECAKVLNQLNPSTYGYLLKDYNDSIRLALAAYPSLYSSYENGNYKDCRDLILRYGWFWFEPIVRERLSYDNEKFVMSHLGEYLSNEDSYSAQCRLIGAWISNDSIDLYLHD